MGRRTGGTLPQVCRHEGTGQGRVRIKGRTFYVGRFGTPEAHARYIELMVGHGYLPAAAAPGPAAEPPAPAVGNVAPEPPPEPTRLPAGNEQVPTGLTVGEVCAMYLSHIEGTVRHGQRSGRYEKALAAVRAVRPLATMPAATFGTRALLDVRGRLIVTPASNRKPDAAGKVPTLARRYINELIGHVRRMFDWAVLHELVPNDRVAALAVVKPLRKGDTTARETKPRKPVRPSIVRATLPYMSREMADLVWFIRLTGCRPSEAARLRLCHVHDRHKPVWRYVPKRHKTAHKGKTRHVPVGPQAQGIIAAHTAGRGQRDYVFTPQRSVPARKPTNGVIPIESRRPVAHARKRFTKDGIMQAVRRAVIRANKERGEQQLPLLPHWTPYQLRYTRLREIRKADGREAAQATAGHSRETMTDHYAPANWRKAARAALASG